MNQNTKPTHTSHLTPDNDSSPSADHEDKAIRYMPLYDGYLVQIDFYDEIKLQVTEVIPVLIPGESYTLKMLCEKVFWNSLSNGERRIAGRCMSHMVIKEILPLIFAYSKHEYPKRYQVNSA